MTDPTPQPDPAVVLTDDERDALRHLALIAHADGYEGRDSGMTQDRVLATVGRIVADALTDAERDQLWAGLRRARYEEAPIPLASEGNRTHVLWALSPAVERIIAARTADTAIRLAAVEAVLADGPETWEGYDSRDTGQVFAADLVLEFIADLRAALSATAPDAGCGYPHVAEPCGACAACQFPAPHAGQREAQERATYQPGPHDSVSQDDDGTTYVDGLPWRINRDGIQAAATTQEGAEAMHARLVQRRADRSPEQP